MTDPVTVSVRSSTAQGQWLRCPDAPDGQPGGYVHSSAVSSIAVEVTNSTAHVVVYTVDGRPIVASYLSVASAGDQADRVDALRMNADTEAALLVHRLDTASRPVDPT